MMDDESGWREMGVGARGVEEDEFSAGSEGNVGHGPSVSECQMVKVLRESGIWNCGGTCRGFHGLEHL